ncbi:hypothetical protein Pelo_12411 [Pelomyxa schiedti]|nr:hypothetical protein Pelo_12411 [Pelomyxa schiedti]
MACTRTEGLQNESFVPVLTMFNQEIHVFWIQHGVIWNSFSSKRHNNRQPWTTFLLSQPHFVPPAGDTCSVARDFSSGTQGCVYRGTDNHVWILVQSAESHWAWDARQVTPVPICSSNPTTESAEGTFWVAYIGSDLNVYVANSNCKTPWNISQLTTTCLATGNPSITLSPWTQHIMYLSLDGQVREIHRGAYNSYKWTEKIHSELPPASMCPQMSICRDNRKMFSKHILGLIIVCMSRIMETIISGSGLQHIIPTSHLCPMPHIWQLHPHQNVYSPYWILFF